MTKTKKSEFIMEVIPLELLPYKTLYNLKERFKECYQDALDELMKVGKENINMKKAVKGMKQTVKKWRDKYNAEHRKLTKLIIEINSLKSKNEMRGVVKKVKIGKLLADIDKREEEEEKSLQEQVRWMMR